MTSLEASFNWIKTLTDLLEESPDEGSAGEMEYVIRVQEFLCPQGEPDRGFFAQEFRSEHLFHLLIELITRHARLLTRIFEERVQTLQEAGWRYTDVPDTWEYDGELRLDDDPLKPDLQGRVHFEWLIEWYELDLLLPTVRNELGRRILASYKMMYREIPKDYTKPDPFRVMRILYEMPRAPVLALDVFWNRLLTGASGVEV